MSNNNKKKGFTLIELLLTIIIIGLLSWLVINKITGEIGFAKQAAYKQTLANIAKSSPYIASTLLAASDTGTNQLDSTLTLKKYNTIAASISGGLVINTSPESAETILLHVSSNKGVVKVFDSRDSTITLQGTSFTNHIQKTRAMSKRLRYLDVKQDY